MKSKKVLLIVLIVTLLSLTLSLSACGQDVKVTYMVDGEIYGATWSKLSSVRDLPKDPTKKDWSFEGWFLDDGTFAQPLVNADGSIASVADGTKVYAKFEKVYFNYIVKNTASANKLYWITGLTSHAKQLTAIDIGNAEYNRGISFYGIYAGGIESANLETLIIPDCVKVIDHKAIVGCEKLKSITLPFIGESASTTNMNTNKTVFGYIFDESMADDKGAIRQYTTRSIGYKSIVYDVADVTAYDTIVYNGAFSFMTSLKNINLPNVEEIGVYAFRGCTNLDSVNLGKNLAKIKTSAFVNSNITTINFAGTKLQWEEIDKVEGWNEDSRITKIKCSNGTISLLS